jgi:DNA-binding NarL/FixJ family response regulator
MSDTKQIQCVVGDDHEALRRGLVAVLEAEDDIKVIGQARDGRGILELAERRRPDVTIVDIAMPGLDGIEVCRDLSAQEWPTSVVLYTGSGEPDVLQSALDAGACGFVLKSGPPQDVVRAVRAASAGLTYIDATLGASLITRRRDVAAILSQREAEVLQLLADGHTTESAATALFLSPATVRSYVENGMHKLEARNRVHAVATALRMGLVS